MQVELRIVGSSQLGSSMFMIGAIRIDRQKFLIGREPECHFRPNSVLVSRHHCVLLRDEFTLRVRDLGSKNGTFVNGEEVHGDVVLEDEDVIVLGDMTLQVIFSDAEEFEHVESDTALARDEHPTESLESATSRDGAMGAPGGN